MPRLDNEAIEKTKKYLEKIKVFTIGQLTSSLKCSIPSARLKLRQWNTYTSFNQNGRFYTLPNVPIFDDYGLWRFKDINFCKHGNLKKTIVHLVYNSTSGLTGKQIGNLLGLSPQSFLHHFREYPGICREKYGGVHIYFSDEPNRYKQQVQNISATFYPDMLFTISDTDAVLILVALIKHHNISFDDILALPEIKRRKLSAAAIERFLESHGLQKKIMVTKL